MCPHIKGHVIKMFFGKVELAMFQNHMYKLSIMYQNIMDKYCTV